MRVTLHHVASHLVKYQQGVDKGVGSVLVGTLSPSSWAILESHWSWWQGLRFLQGLPTNQNGGKTLGLTGKRASPLWRAGKSGSDPQRGSHRVRSSDHRGFMLSVKKLNCITYSACGASFPLQKDSIDIIDLFLKYEQMPTSLAWVFFMHRLSASETSHMERFLHLFLLFRSSLRHWKQISKSLQFTNTHLPSLSVDLGKFPKCNQSPLCFSASSESAWFSG